MKLLCSFLLLAAALPAQPPTDMQLLLNEVRQLRHDLAEATFASQRVQIILYRLQIEESALTRATQRVDQARTQLNGLQQRRVNRANELQAMEAELARTQDASQKAHLPQMIAGLKQDSETWTAQEQEAQSRQIEAESQLRAEQAKRDALEASLDKLEKQLESNVGH